MIGEQSIENNLEGSSRDLLGSYFGIWKEVVMIYLGPILEFGRK
jgi:hypothetical protein